MPETKVCTRCGEEKPLEEFKKDRTKPSGYSQPCIKCHVDRDRQRQLNDPEYRVRKLEYMRKYNTKRRREDPEYRERSRERWRERYWNEPGFARKRINQSVQYKRRTRMERREQGAVGE